MQSSSVQDDVALLHQGYFKYSIFVRSSPLDHLEQSFMQPESIRVLK